MLAGVALAIRLLGIYLLWKSLLSLSTLTLTLYWWYEAASFEANMAAKHINGWQSTVAEEKLNLLTSSAGVADIGGLVWLQALHFVFWLLLGSLCWSQCAALARLIMKGVPMP